MQLFSLAKQNNNKIKNKKEAKNCQRWTSLPPLRSNNMEITLPGFKDQHKIEPQESPLHAGSHDY